jgi:NitT/TauT family transport system substrate-binding protein
VTAASFATRSFSPIVLKKLAVFSLQLVLCAVLPMSVSPAETARLRVSYASLSPSSSILALTQEAGFFRREGLDVEVLYVAAGSLNVQALMSKELQISTLGGPAVVQAGLQGADLVFIGGIANRLMVALVAQSSIKRVNDLRNKKVGITRFGSNIDLQARTLLNRLGISPTKDVALLQIGGNVERLAALKSGLIEATLFSPEMIGRAKEEGFTILFDPTKSAPIPWQQTGVVTSREFITMNREVVRRSVRAIFNGMHRFKTEPELAVKFLARFLNQNNAALLREAYQEYVGEFPWPPYPTREGIAFILEQLGKTSSKKPDDFLDLSFITELERQGFFRK